jgi:hypothetical protein
MSDKKNQTPTSPAQPEEQAAVQHQAPAAEAQQAAHRDHKTVFAVSEGERHGLNLLHKAGQPKAQGEGENGPLTFAWGDITNIISFITRILDLLKNQGIEVSYQGRAVSAEELTKSV